MRLYGRETESRRIDSLLDAARAGKSGALVLRGEPGIGKTALLRYAHERSLGMTVLRARGLEVEMQLAFTGLADLFGPVLDRLDALPEPQSASLAGALGIGPPVAGDRFVSCVATLSMLAAAAEQKPLLALVDDCQWLDEASREALFFAGRRLDAESVALVLSITDPASAELSPAGLDQLTVTGLLPGDCRALLSDVVISPVATAVANQLCRATRGNPLALREIVSHLSVEQLAGEKALDDPLSAAAGVKAALLRRVGGLSQETQSALLVAAASFGVTSTINEACSLLGIQESAVEPAEHAGVIRREDGRTTFSHPLLRAAVYHSATESERGLVHAALAEALELQDGDANDEKASAASERRAWQLAAATRSPSEPVAAALEQTAAASRSRGGYAAAASALERAASLTPRDGDRARRLFVSARDWQLAGHAGPALRLLAEALSLTDDVCTRAEIEHLRGQLEMSRGEFGRAYRLLAAEATSAATVDEARASLMLADAAVSASTVGEFATAVRLGRAARALGERAGGTAAQASEMICGALLVSCGEADEGTKLVMRHARSPRGEEPAPYVLMVMPTVLNVLEEYDSARGFLDWLIELARGLSAPSLLVPALPLRADWGYRTGDWLAAHADGVEGLRLARETNGNVGHALAYLMQIEAGLGLESECRDHAAELLAIANQMGIGAGFVYSHAFLGRLALAVGQIDEAVFELEEAVRLNEQFGLREPNWVQEMPDLIESYVRAGRREKAAPVLERLEARAERTGRIWSLAASARCRGLLADESAFPALFEEALSLHERKPIRFERARTQLCYGERLRRARKSRAARTQLYSALESFDQLCATPWSKRARSELAATGATVGPQGTDGLRELTPQELQLALIVGRGATNKEASAALFISPKTVEAHLHRIYGKLAVRSRTELARHLARHRILD